MQIQGLAFAGGTSIGNRPIGGRIAASEKRGAWARYPVDARRKRGGVRSGLPGWTLGPNSEPQGGNYTRKLRSFFLYTQVNARI